MKHIKNSDYALNRYSEGIVYRFADGTQIEITLADFLTENPNKTESDFLAIKDFSDGIYHTQDRACNAQTKKNISIDGIDEALLYLEPSPEELLIDAFDAREEAKLRQERLNIACHILDKLTEKQRRRYLLHIVDGLSTWQIAEIESTNQKSVYESLQAAEKKIKKVLASA